MSNSNQIKGEERGKPVYLWKGERRLNEVHSTRVQWPLCKAGGLGAGGAKAPAGYKGSTPGEIQVKLQKQNESGIFLQLQLPFLELGY